MNNTTEIIDNIKDYRIIIPYAIICIIITIFTILVIIIYCKNKIFRTMPSYFNIIFCLIITSDNILRFLPTTINKKKGEEQLKTEQSLDCKLQAIFMTFLDKLIFLMITIYSQVFYFSQFTVTFYQNHTKGIYIFLFITCFMIALTLTMIFFFIRS